MKIIKDNLIKMLTELRVLFDQEGWYSVVSDRHNFNQNPDLSIEFDTGFDYQDVRALSIIDIENRIVLNAYFYIVDKETLYMMGDKTINADPVIYRKSQLNFEEFKRDVKRVMNYY